MIDISKTSQSIFAINQKLTPHYKYSTQSIFIINQELTEKYKYAYAITMLYKKSFNIYKKFLNNRVKLTLDGLSKGEDYDYIDVELKNLDQVNHNNTRHHHILYYCNEPLEKDEYSTHKGLTINFKDAYYPHGFMNYIIDRHKIYSIAHKKGKYKLAEYIPDVYVVYEMKAKIKIYFDFVLNEVVAVLIGELNRGKKFTPI